MKKNVLIVGSGGREHALAWKLAQSPRIGNLYVAPGNGGTSSIAHNVPISAIDIDQLSQFAQINDVHITIVGPDEPLALGIVDTFQAKGLRIFGPTQAAAKIEWSKVFAKQVMREIGIPTATFEVFTDFDTAFNYALAQPLPIVVKADGLAQGKGVYVCETLPQIHHALTALLRDRAHTQAGTCVLVEEYLDGPEFSVHAFCDGRHYWLFPTAQDHKPIGNGNTGKNTGGMGTVAPLQWVNQDVLTVIGRQIVHPILRVLLANGSPFTGVLYPGIKLTKNGPKVVEFNARFGDPEAQSFLPLLQTDLLDIIEVCLDGRLDSLPPLWSDQYTTCLVLASRGYPDTYQTGFPIEGIAQAEQVPDVRVFHAGTAWKGDVLVTNGGRVLGVTAMGPTPELACARAYGAAQMITFDGMYCRSDIGKMFVAGPNS